MVKEDQLIFPANNLKEVLSLIDNTQIKYHFYLRLKN